MSQKVLQKEPQIYQEIAETREVALDNKIEQKTRELKDLRERLDKMIEESSRRTSNLSSTILKRMVREGRETGGTETWTLCRRYRMIVTS